MQSMLDANKLFPRISRKHQLNNEGCRCRLCQKIVISQGMKIIKKDVADFQSECYSDKTNEGYIQVITYMAEFDRNPRRVRFALPEICVFEKGTPVRTICKKRDKDLTNIVQNKSKLHQFEIYNFFLEGFMHHNPGRVVSTDSAGRRKASYAELLRTECVVVGKYKRNGYQMLNLTQLQGLFKSKQKYLRDGLIYLQTLLGSQHQQERVRLMEESFTGTLFQKAKHQAKIILGEIKSADLEYTSDKEALQFEQSLKKQDLKEYLKYMTLKMVLLVSKKTNEMMKDCMFKYVCVKEAIYLIDVRVNQVASADEIWSQSVKAAFQYKLAKRMSMMELETPRDTYLANSLGRKAREMSQWLENSSDQEWGQINTIKNRLQKLQSQKRSLILSQSHEQSSMPKHFKIRTSRKIHANSMMSGKSNF